MSNNTKMCYKCGEVFPLTFFWKCKKAPDGLQHYCHNCQNKSKIASYHGSGRKRLLRQYNMIPLDFTNKLKEQGGKCAICRVSKNECGKNFVVDHDHKTNKVRGLLCDKCNRALGGFKDSTKLLTKALNYLKGNK